MPDDDLDDFRCLHGNLLLGCPHKDCPEQNAYLAEQDAAMEAWYERQREETMELLSHLVAGHGLPVLGGDLYSGEMDETF